MSSGSFTFSVWTVEPAAIILASSSSLSRPHGFSLALFGWLGLSGLTLPGGKGWVGMELAEKHLRFLPVLKEKLSVAPAEYSSYRQAAPRCPRHIQIDFVLVRQELFSVTSGCSSLSVLSRSEHAGYCFKKVQPDE